MTNAITDKITNSTGTKNESRFMTGRELMVMVGFKSPSAFHTWFHREGVPFVRLTSRKIMFERVAIEAWLKTRTVGGAV